MTYDCTTFFNENDLLEVRINQHWSFVDKFIIVEARETHTGLPKALNFDHERFSKYSEKIVYRVIDSFEEEMAKYPDLSSKIFEANTRSQPDLAFDDWIRGYFQVEYCTKVLFDLEPKDSDLVLLSSLDEIFKAEKVAETYPIFNLNQKFSLRSNIFKDTKFSNDVDPIFNFWTSLYAYKLNLYSKEACVGLITTVCNLKYLKHTDLRNFWFLTHQPIENAGWHFTFLDDTDGEKTLTKYKSWPHSRDSTNGKKKYFDIQTKEEAVQSVFKDYNLKKVEVTLETHPKFLIENLGKYSNYIY
jgi:beta-1,4-mannosyl-glycoprotein beta-1,4-N-acetylglucosaminyltransferase